MEEVPVRKRARNGASHPRTWKQNTNFEGRQKGQPYIGHVKESGEVQNKVKAGRKIKESCNCALTDTRQCASFREDDRKSIFKKVWQDSTTWESRQTYISTLIDRRTVSRRRSAGGMSRRNYSLCYYLKKDGVRKPVCKKMFLSTTGIGERSALNWIKGPDCNNEQEFDENDRKRHSEYYTRAEEQKVFLREQFLAVLPKLPSHYCRKSTNKLYLEQSIKSMNDLHRIYVEKCNAENQKPLGIKLLRDEFNQMNLALFQPKKDQCDICVARNTGNLSDEEWEFHLGKKEAARKEKALDKERASENDRLLVTTMDLQAVLLSPCLKASALYYKTKLAVHNFTVYDLK